MLYYLLHFVSTFLCHFKNRNDVVFTLDLLKISKFVEPPSPLTCVRTKWMTLALKLNYKLSGWELYAWLDLKTDLPIVKSHSCQQYRWSEYQPGLLFRWRWRRVYTYAYNIFFFRWLCLHYHPNPTKNICSAQKINGVKIVLEQSPRKRAILQNILLSFKINIPLQWCKQWKPTIQGILYKNWNCYIVWVGHDTLSSTTSMFNWNSRYKHFKLYTSNASQHFMVCESDFLQLNLFYLFCHVVSHYQWSLRLFE